MAVRAWYLISGCTVVDCGACMVIEEWLICSERGPCVDIEQYLVVAVRCPCVIFYQ
jgi:hypothetical protein